MITSVCDHTTTQKPTYYIHYTDGILHLIVGKFYEDNQITEIHDLLRTLLLKQRDSYCSIWGNDDPVKITRTPDCIPNRIGCIMRTLYERIDVNLIRDLFNLDAWITDVRFPKFNHSINCVPLTLGSQTFVTHGRISFARNNFLMWHQSPR
jgi:hypothetical protein